MKKILVINGPNLNLLGQRETDIYGTRTLEDINQALQESGQAMQAAVECFQSNHEGAIIDKIHSARHDADAIIINAGAFSHYSIAIVDALRSFAGPVIEVHLSNIYQREAYRHVSLISEVARGGIFGLGDLGYQLALQAALACLKEN